MTPLPSHPAGAGGRIRYSINNITERGARAFQPSWSLGPIQVIDCTRPDWGLRHIGAVDPQPPFMTAPADGRVGSTLCGDGRTRSGRGIYPLLMVMSSYGPV